LCCGVAFHLQMNPTQHLFGVRCWYKLLRFNSSCTNPAAAVPLKAAAAVAAAAMAKAAAAAAAAVVVAVAEAL